MPLAISYSPNRPQPGTTITVTATVTDAAGAEADASGIEASWKRGLYGTETSESLASSATGVYTFSFVPEAGGNHYVRVDTGEEGDAIDVAQEIIIPVRDSSFDDFR